MDFKSYYLLQASGDHPVFRGSPYQRGYGLGGIFRRFFTWVLPILRDHGMPIVKSVGKELISNAANIATEAIDGRDIKNSVEEKIKEGLEKLKNQKGSGVKRKHKHIEISSTDPMASSINKMKNEFKNKLEFLEKNPKKRKLYNNKFRDIFSK